MISQPPSSTVRHSGRFRAVSPAAPLPHLELELTVVMPCLNEAETLRTCISKARRALDAAGISGEIVVADQGSTDGSQRLAESLGARVVHVETRGYGSALMRGIDAACGTYVLIADANDCYDFSELPKFVAKLREGYDLVQGCRLPAGGGTVQPGAMPPLQRWVGNPMLTWMVRHWFNAPIHDVQCGMRAFSKALYARLDQRCTGMEFISENIIKASIHGARIAEVPITLHRDGRSARLPTPGTARDGWRNLRFFLLYSPRWLFLLPGTLLLLLGVLGYGLALPQFSALGVTFDVTTLLFASLSILAGFQALLVAVFARTFAISEGLLPVDARTARLSSHFTLERGLMAGAVAMLVGLVLLGTAVLHWSARSFGELGHSATLRVAIPGFTIASVGVQTMFASFFLSILGLHRR